MRYLLTGLFGLLTIGILYSCQKELSVEYSSAAKGSLQSAAGDCLPKTVGGAYVAAKTLIDSNFIDVSVTVTSPGPYKIYTDTLNGYAFIATGTFAASGPTTVRLKGGGTPALAGTDGFTVYFDSSYCDVDVTVLPAGTSGGAAVYTLGATGGACAPTPFTPSGNYVKDTTLNATNFITVTVNVTAVGTYSINTTTVNGYFFAATGTFGATGAQTIKLFGSGKPTAAGTDNFTVTGGASTCTFSVTVTATAPAGCSPNVQGTYTAGTAATAANQVTLTHTYATAGTYTVNTNTVNGYSFGSSPITAIAGANTVTLTATGTPAAAGTDNFTVSFGDGQTCSFSVTVVPGTVVANADYFPTTQGSYWTYDDGTGADTFKVTVNGTAIFSGNTYQKFLYSDASGPLGTGYYRKDPVTSFYYQSLDTAGTGAQGFSFNQARLDLLFLKSGILTGASWNWDFACTFAGIPSKIRFKYSCINSNDTKTVNGKTFTNVYKIQEDDLVDLGNTGNFQAPPGVGPTTYYYAKGIGLIAAEDENGAIYQAIRYWVVN